MELKGSSEVLALPVTIVFKVNKPQILVGTVYEGEVRAWCVCVARRLLRAALLGASLLVVLQPRACAAVARPLVSFSLLTRAHAAAPSSPCAGL